MEIMALQIQVVSFGIGSLASPIVGDLKLECGGDSLRDFILDVPRDVFPITGVILEIASGSGELFQPAVVPYRGVLPPPAFDQF